MEYSRGSDISWDDLQDEIATARRLSRDFHSMPGSDTSWDDLQDEIATAMTQSMMIDASGRNTNDNGKHCTNSKHSSSPLRPHTIDDKSKNGSGEIKHKEADQGAWNCPACTFLNENPLHLVCAICGTAQPPEST